MWVCKNSIRIFTHPHFIFPKVEYLKYSAVYFCLFWILHFFFSISHFNLLDHHDSLWLEFPRFRFLSFIIKIFAISVHVKKNPNKMCIFSIFSFKYSCKSLILFKAFFLFVVTKFRRVSQKKKAHKRRKIWRKIHTVYQNICCN